MFSTESIPKRLKVPFPRKWLVLKQCHLLKRNAPFFQGTLRPLNESVCWKMCSCQLILLWFTYAREKCKVWMCFSFLYLWLMQHFTTESETVLLVLFSRCFWRDSCQEVFEFKTRVVLFFWSKVASFSRGKLQKLKFSLKGITHSVAATPS